MKSLFAQGSCVAVALVAGALFLSLFARVEATEVYSADAVLLNFTQGNCPPCQKMAPVVGKLQGAGYAVKTIGLEKHQALFDAYRVGATPTFVMVVNGKETGRITGPTSAHKLKKLYPTKPRRR